jgi:hypothetical protein
VVSSRIPRNTTTRPAENDDGDFEAGQSQIEDHVTSVSTGRGRVAFDQLATC